MRLHTHQQPKMVLPPTTMVVKAKYDNYINGILYKAGDHIATITRNGRKAVLEVARAHYSGPDYAWEWA